MFSVNGTTITISRGDTGAVKLTATATRKDNGQPFIFGERDRALFSIKNSAGELVRQKSYPLNNNIFTVVFVNSDTDNISGSSFSWDVRYVINPYYDEDPPDGPWPQYEELEFPIQAGQKCQHDYVCYIANQTISTEETWTSAHWTEAWTDYDDLSFPVAKGDRCMHEGTYYFAAQAIASSEEWTPSHWMFSDYRVPVDGDQVITPNTPMAINLLNIVGDI